MWSPAIVVLLLASGVIGRVPSSCDDAKARAEKDEASLSEAQARLLLQHVIDQLRC